MSPYPRNLLKARMDFKMDRIYVFTTSITLNERFSHKRPRHVFIYNNGFTSSYKNNCVKARIGFPNRNTGANRMFSSYSEGDFQKNYRGNAYRRQRSVMNPTKFENDVEYIQNERSPFNGHGQSRSYYFRSYKPNMNTGRYKYVAQRFYRPFYRRPKRDSIFPSWCLPDRYRFAYQLPYKWKRKQQVSKAELDDEIDRYMAEVKLKPITISVPKDEDAMSTSTAEQYLRETEKYLKETEDSDWLAL